MGLSQWFIVCMNHQSISPSWKAIFCFGDERFRAPPHDTFLSPEHLALTMDFSTPTKCSHSQLPPTCTISESLYVTHKKDLNKKTKEVTWPCRKSESLSKPGRQRAVSRATLSKGDVSLRCCAERNDTAHNWDVCFQTVQSSSSKLAQNVSWSQFPRLYRIPSTVAGN